MTDSEVQVRRADPADLAGVVALGDVVVPATYGSLSPAYARWCLGRWWSEDEVAGSLDRLPHWVAADRTGRVVGVANLGVLDGGPVMWKLYVHPEHHRTGLGSRLLAEVLRATGEAPLVLEHLGGNDRAAAFYAAHGFVETHRTVAEAFPDLTWVWMRRTPEVDPS